MGKHGKFYTPSGSSKPKDPAHHHQRHQTVLADTQNVSQSSNARLDTAPEVSRNLEDILDYHAQRGTTSRDILCCLARFETKEWILQKLRDIVENTKHLYQYLAASTITQSGLLKPITLSLREHGISFKWGFPFALLAHRGGKVFFAMIPCVRSLVCQQLDIPVADVPSCCNYIRGPSEDNLMVPFSDGPTTSINTRDQTPYISSNTKWWKRLNTQSPAQLPSTPLTKRQS
ncbi:hypothetical protein XELAEV_18012825mg [Xenopus laevis]|uniref:Uncharacterized protein n=1 Tax=Xenopus laevis TaxID=8355 RepID=A0A974DQ96_XENLA|nr:hypothetical protein XELAEV_18012825mg [Xenopus laevis]